MTRQSSAKEELLRHPTKFSCTGNTEECEKLWDHYRMYDIRALCRLIFNYFRFIRSSTDLASDELNTPPVNIDWIALSQALEKQHKVKWTPFECQSIWKFVAYQKEPSELDKEQLFKSKKSPAKPKEAAPSVERVPESDNAAVESGVKNKESEETKDIPKEKAEPENKEPTPELDNDTDIEDISVMNEGEKNKEPEKAVSKSKTTASKKANKKKAATEDTAKTPAKTDSDKSTPAFTVPQSYFRENRPTCLVLDSHDETHISKTVQRAPAGLKRVPINFVARQSIPSIAKPPMYARSHLSMHGNAVHALKKMPSAQRKVSPTSSGAPDKGLIGTKRKAPSTEVSPAMRRPMPPMRPRSCLQFYKQYCQELHPELVKATDATLMIYVKQHWPLAPAHIKVKMEEKAIEDRRRYNREYSRLKKWEQMQITIGVKKDSPGGSAEENHSMATKGTAANKSITSAAAASKAAVNRALLAAVASGRKKIPPEALSKSPSASKAGLSGVGGSVAAAKLSGITAAAASIPVSSAAQATPVAKAVSSVKPQNTPTVQPKVPAASLKTLVSPASARTPGVPVQRSVAPASVQAPVAAVARVKTPDSAKLPAKEKTSSVPPVVPTPAPQPMSTGSMDLLVQAIGQTLGADEAAGSSAKS